jgi:hypothetical protein
MLTHGSFLGFNASAPSLLANIPTAPSPAPQRPVCIKAMQVATSPDTEFIPPAANAFAACIESNFRRTTRVRSPTVRRRSGRVTD